MSTKEKKVVTIAFPTSDNETIDGHFGHTKEFVIYTVIEDEIRDVTHVTPPKHEPGVLPAFLANQGINVIITGGMGQMAVDLFNKQGIDVILGASGLITINLNEFLNGLLSTKGSSCKHEHGETHEH